MTFLENSYFLGLLACTKDICSVNSGYYPHFYLCRPVGESFSYSKKWTNLAALQMLHCCPLLICLMQKIKIVFPKSVFTMFTLFCKCCSNEACVEIILGKRLETVVNSPHRY
jgi:hypothetical protein